MMMTLYKQNIRPARLDDLDQLNSLLTQLFEQEIEFHPNPSGQLTALKTLIENPDLGILLVSCETDKILGMVSLLFTVSTALGGKVALLEDMIVTPDSRGQGIGSALLKAAINKATELKCCRITLLTDGDNTAAQQFYQKQGFQASSMQAYRMLLEVN